MKAIRLRRSMIFVFLTGFRLTDSWREILSLTCFLSPVRSEMRFFPSFNRVPHHTMADVRSHITLFVVEERDKHVVLVASTAWMYSSTMSALNGQIVRIVELMYHP